jgi:hypothetical protein
MAAKLPVRIRPLGKGTQRWSQWRQRQRALVAQRNYGRCEGYECRALATDWHHVFGKRHIIAEPLASHHTMTAGLCRDCHNHIHNNPASFAAQIVRKDALDRGARWFHSPPFAEASLLEDWLRATGEWEDLCVAAGR